MLEAIVVGITDSRNVSNQHERENMTVNEKTWQLHKPKGEWRLCGTGSFGEIREDGKAIAYPAFCSSDAESDNRLALMAAAPELLAACQSALACFLMDSDMEEDFAEEIALARAAISKAEKGA